MTPTTLKGKTALVIGATGGVGGAVTRCLLNRGWSIRALNRDPERASQPKILTGVRWIKGDAMNLTDVVAAALGVDLIVHAANPPGYRDWNKLVLPMLESSIAAARASGAVILFPGTVYNYGPDLYDQPGGAVVRETSPQNPVTRKGKIRAEMERRLKTSGVKTIIVRAGDFFGPGNAASSWFSQFVQLNKPVRSVVYPGDRNAGHAWAYLPDLAEAMVRLVERRDELPTFAAFHFDGHWIGCGVELAQAVLRVAGRPSGKVRSFPWFAVIGLSPVVPMFREFLEMRYLWKRPLRLDNAKLTAFLGEEPHTPLDRAVASALTALGCLNAGDVAAPAAPLSLNADGLRL